MLYGKELYFGNLFKLKKLTNSYNCIVLQLLLNNVLELNGHVNLDNLNKCKKKHLWIYFLYLSKNNPGIHPFSHISYEDDLYFQLKNIITTNYPCKYEYLLKKDIAGYINQILDNNENINIAFLDQIINLLMKKVDQMDSNLIQMYNNLIQNDITSVWSS